MGPLRLGESTSPAPPVTEIEQEPPIVTPERENFGQLIAFALLALLFVVAVWFVVRHVGGHVDSTAASAPKV
jgi:hypothetical protein